MEFPPRNFFATRDDLVPGLERLEKDHALEYLLNELLDEELFVRRTSLLEDPHLGQSLTGSTTTDPDYLVFPQSHPASIRKVQRDGAPKYAAEPSPETILFRPGGLHAESGALVAGRLARGIHPSAAGKLLHDAFASEIFAGFKKVRGFFVGPGAYRELKDGRRLATLGAKYGPDFDLVDAAS
jgi:hypothetical protein